MSTMKPDSKGGFSFQGVTVFQRLDSRSNESANLVFRCDDGLSLGIPLPRSDLVLLHAALSDWLRK